MKTTFDFNLSGLDSATAPTSVEFATAGSFLPPFLYDPTGSPTLSEIFGYDSNLDWSKINTAFLLQYEPVSLGSLNNLVLGPELTLSNLALTNGATNAISATLQPSPQAALSLSVTGSQWAALFANAGPAPAIPYSSALPTGFASVVSAPVTISSGAAAPAIQGDARVVTPLSQPAGPRPTLPHRR
jgi:hypothetical protein